MRVFPDRYSTPKPQRVKSVASKVKHFVAPLKGMSLVTKNAEGDPLLAPVLDNFVVCEDKIEVRPGTALVVNFNNGKPVEQLVNFHGPTPRLAAATNNELRMFDGSLLKGGFTGNDWHWTFFSNLGDIDYTIMANGKDGVWSWDGGLAAAGVIKEAVTAPVGASHINIDRMHIVVSHMNRLFFADAVNHAFYYLPLQQKSGEVKEFGLNAVFRRGGYITAMASWTIDGGAGMDDCLCIFTSNGECVIYRGIDPESVDTWELVGIFRFDAPINKHCVLNYGGDLFCLIGTGLVPMSTLIRTESEQLGLADKSVLSAFTEVSDSYRNSPGWMLLLDYTSGRMICNMPGPSGGGHKQMIRFMPRPVWASWSGLPARCWGWQGNKLYFGSPDGKVYEMRQTALADDGNPIDVDVQIAWSSYGTPASKHFKMIKIYMITDGKPKPFVDIKVDYDKSKPKNQPDVSEGLGPLDVGATMWGDGDWGVSMWSNRALDRPQEQRTNWTGVGRRGNVGAVRLTARLSGCTFGITGFDVLYEPGSIFG